MTEPAPSPPPPDPRRFSTFVRLVRTESYKVVVSLGGGSVPGLAGNSALCRLLEQLELRDRVEEIWGTSAGAAIGGPWATGTPAEDVLAQVLTLDRKGSIDVAWGRILAGLLLRPFGRPLPDGLIHGRHFAEAIRGALSAPRFEDCTTPFRCIACSDDGQGRTKVFRRGGLLPAIFASMALPGIIIPRPPEAAETTGFYDGGLVEKTPLLSPIAEHLRGGDGRKLLLVATHYGNDAKRVKARGFIGRFVHTIYALEELAWSHQLAQARSRDDVDLVILNPHLVDPKLFDFSRVRANFADAHAAFCDQLENARLAMTFGLR